jgi:hypothetical protein
MPTKIDNPIHESSEDLLDRERHAAQFALEILKADASDGLVIGILGKWGTGKTSFINLMRPTFAAQKATTIDFNPWMFSGSQQLADIFFSELAAQLKLKSDLKDVAAAIEEYGESMSSIASIPIIGAWYGAGLSLTKLANKIIKNRRGGILPLRTKVKNALSELSEPVVVVLDDVDRLTTEEIRDIFKLVRSTASFPNLIYLLAFDRLRVEAALNEQGASGREYIEKILQLTVDLPSIPEPLLQEQLFLALDDAFKDVTIETEIDQQQWHSIYFEIVKPLVKSMRDVRRYVGTLSWTMNSLGGRVSVADILGLEAVRIFLPDTFALLQKNSSFLTSTGGDKTKNEQLFGALMTAVGEHQAIFSSIIRRLFPAASRHVDGGSHYGPEWEHIWLKNKRVASGELLRFYLDRFVSDALRATAKADEVVANMANVEQLGMLFERTPPEDREDLVKAIEAHEDEFKPEHVVPASVVLLNNLPTFPDRRRGFFELDAEMTVGRVVYRLVKVLDNQDAVMAAVEAILPKLEQLSLKLQLITMVGYRENAGHKLVSEAQAAALEKSWRSELSVATPEALEGERDLLRVFFEERHQLGEDAESTPIPDNPRVTYAMLKSARTETKVQSGDNPYIEYKPRLMWDVLVKVYGSEQKLIERIQDLRAGMDSSDELIDFAISYAEGWRPANED